MGGYRAGSIGEAGTFPSGRLLLSTAPKRILNFFGSWSGCKAVPPGFLSPAPITELPRETASGRSGPERGREGYTSHSTRAIGARGTANPVGPPGDTNPGTESEARPFPVGVELCFACKYSTDQSVPERHPLPPQLDTKRHRILAAAREVCARSGYEAARMEEIARVAGVSKGTLYNFFDNKEALLVSTVLAGYQDFVVVLPAVDDPAADPRERLEALIESLAGGFAGIAQHQLLAHQAWSVVLNSEAARAELLASLRAIYSGYIETLESILRSGIEAGVIRPETDIHTVATNWVAVYDGLLYRAGFEEGDPNPAYTPAGVRRSLGWLMEQLLITEVGEEPATPGEEETNA